MEAFYGSVGHFNLGDTFQVHDVLDTGSVVVVVYRR